MEKVLRQHAGVNESIGSCQVLLVTHQWEAESEK